LNFLTKAACGKTSYETFHISCLFQRLRILRVARGQLLLWRCTVRQHLLEGAKEGRRVASTHFRRAVGVVQRQEPDLAPVDAALFDPAAALVVCVAPARLNLTAS
jgi:hypothetical protein